MKDGKIVKKISRRRVRENAKYIRNVNPVVGTVPQSDQVLGDSIDIGLLKKLKVKKAAKAKKTKRTVHYLGCDIDTYKKYIEEQFEDGMTWENHGEWHIDHIIPLKYTKSETTIEDRLHYKNTQPLWGCENMEKGNRYIG